MTDESQLPVSPVPAHGPPGLKGRAAVAPGLASSVGMPSVGAGPVPPPLAGRYAGTPAVASEASAKRHEQWRAAGDHAQRITGEALLGLRRILKSSFYLERATEAERGILAKAKIPVLSPLAQDYAGWRRTTLWLCAVLLGLATFFGLFSTHWVGSKTVGTAWNATVVNLLYVVLLLSQGGAAALLVFAALHWTDIKRTRRLSRFAWFVQFFAPFVVFAVPLHALIDLPPLETIAFSIAMATTALAQLGPRVFGLFPGLIRSSLTLKTLLPESGVPGWVAVAVSPLYSLLFAVLAVLVIQSGLSWWLTAAMVCMVVAPLLCVFRVRRLMSPLPPLDAHRAVAAVRRQMVILILLAVVCALIFVIANDRIEISFWQLLVFLTGVFANVFLLTVVCSDLLLGLMHHAFEQSRVFAGTAMQASLAGKLGNFATVGLTDLETGEFDFVGDLLSDATQAGRDWFTSAPVEPVATEAADPQTKTVPAAAPSAVSGDAGDTVSLIPSEPPVALTGVEHETKVRSDANT